MRKRTWLLEALGAYRQREIDIFDIGTYALAGVSLLNAIVIAAKDEPAIRLLTHVLPYVLLIPINEYMRKKKYTWFPGLLSLAISLNMFWGEEKYTGMAFYIYAVDLIKNARVRLGVYILQAIMIIFYNTLHGRDLNNLLVMLFVYALAVVIYLFLTKRNLPKVVSEEISRKDKKILRLLAADYSYKQIAYELGTSYDTIKKHVADIRKQFGYKGNEGLIHYLDHKGILPPN